MKNLSDYLEICLVFVISNFCFQKLIFCPQAGLGTKNDACTGKSLSEALIFASTNPQYDNRSFIELQVQYMKSPSSDHGANMLCTEIVFDIQNNLCTQYVLYMFQACTFHVLNL